MKTYINPSGVFRVQNVDKDLLTAEEQNEIGGICVYDHCCPPLTISKNGTIKLGRIPHRTDLLCSPDHPVAIGFYHTYCDEENRKLSVIEKFQENGASQTKVAGSTCSLNLDYPEGTVCVWERGDSSKCYFLVELKDSAFEFLLKILLVAVILERIGQAISLVFFVYYSRTPKKNNSYSNYSPQLIVQ